jgi:hypothetical protein
LARPGLEPEIFQLQCNDLKCKVGSGQMGLDQMRSGQMGSDQMGSGQMESGQMGSGQMKSGHIGSFQIETDWVISVKVRSWLAPLNLWFMSQGTLFPYHHPFHHVMLCHVIL